MMAPDVVVAHRHPEPLNAAVTTPGRRKQRQFGVLRQLRMY
jgi:hypothetical protein